MKKSSKSSKVVKVRKPVSKPVGRAAEPRKETKDEKPEAMSATAARRWLDSPDTWAEMKLVASKAIRDVVLKAHEQALNFAELLASKVAGNVAFGRAAYAVQYAIGMSGGKRGAKHNHVLELCEAGKIMLMVKHGRGGAKREVPEPADTGSKMVKAILLTTMKDSVPTSAAIRNTIEQIRRSALRYAKTQDPQLPVPRQKRGGASDSLVNSNTKAKIGRVFVSIGPTAASRRNIPFSVVELENKDDAWVPVLKKGAPVFDVTLINALYATLADEDRLRLIPTIPLSRQCGIVAESFVRFARAAEAAEAKVATEEAKPARKAGAGAVPQPAEVLAKSAAA